MDSKALGALQDLGVSSNLAAYRLWGLGRLNLSEHCFPLMLHVKMKRQK